MNFSRRNFIKTTGAGVVATGMPAIVSGAVAGNPPAPKDLFRLAIAG